MSCTGMRLVQESSCAECRSAYCAGVCLVQECVLYMNASCVGMRLVYECVLCRNASCTGMRPVRGKLRYATDQQLAYAK